MITQIYAIQNAAEALRSIEAGSDYLGMLPVISGPVPEANTGEIPDAAMREIMAATEGKCKRVALSVSNDPEYFKAMAREYHPDLIQIASVGFHITKEFRDEFKAEFPDIGIIQAVSVGWDRAVVAEAAEYAKWADMLILDTLNTDLAGVIGASGKGHSREIDREIIEKVDIPVIVAGGLDEENVTEIIRQTRPFGVDTMTRTNLVVDGKKTMFKDFGKLRLFCERAHEFE